MLLKSFSLLQVLEELEKEIQDEEGPTDATAHQYIDKVVMLL